MKINLILFLTLVNLLSCSQFSKKRLTASGFDDLDVKYIHDESDFTRNGRHLNTQLDDEALISDIALGPVEEQNPTRSLLNFSHWLAGKLDRPVLTYKDWSKIKGISMGRKEVIFQDNQFKIIKLFLDLIAHNDNTYVIHFNITGFDIEKAFFDPVFSNKVISREFRAIILSENLFQRTAFYRDGKKIDSEKVIEELKKIKKQFMKNVDINPFPDYIGD